MHYCVYLDKEKADCSIFLMSPPFYGNFLSCQEQQGLLRGQDSLKGEMEGKNVYGGDEFAKAINSKFNVAMKIKSRGRPSPFFP